MRFLVFGAGAIGSLIGGSLARKHAVTLVARPAQVAAVRRSGLLIRGLTELRVHPHAVEDATRAETPDVVIVTVKSYDTATAAASLRPFRNSAAFLSLQNGLGNVELLSGAAQRVLGGITYHGVTAKGPGEIYHAGRGETIFGPVQGTSHAEAEAIASAFRGCGLAASVTDEVRIDLWTKAVVNACFNPLTGLLRTPSGALETIGALRECCGEVVDEALAVAAAHGVALDGPALLARVAAVASATALNRSSMLQDLERGRRTEIEAINGAIWRMGEAKGIACPVNATLTRLVRAAEELAAPRPG